MSHTPRGWDLVLSHLLDELGAPPRERDEPRWAAHRRVPRMLHRNERLVEVAEGLEGRGRRTVPGLLVATNRRLLFAPLEDEEALERWALRSLVAARLDSGLLMRERSLVIATEAGERRFRELAPASRAPHVLAAVNREIAAPGRKADAAWSRSPAIAGLGELTVHLDQIRLPGGGVRPIEPGVGAHVDVGRPGAAAAEPPASIALHLEGRDWTWATELPADWIDEARAVTEAVHAAARLAGHEGGSRRDPVLDRLERVARLRGLGVLTEEEALEQKERILAEGGGAEGPPGDRASISALP